MIADLHRRHGVDLRLGVGVKGVESGAVTTDDGETLRADAILVGIGAEPEVAWRARPVANLLGGEETYTRLPYFYTDQYEFGMEYRGHAAGDDELVVRGSVADLSISRSGSPTRRYRSPTSKPRGGVGLSRR